MQMAEVATRSARRLSPKSSGTVFRLLMLYVIGLTGLIGVGYISAGMPLVDSAMHSLTTISTGGFSTQVGSIGAYQSGAIEWVGVRRNVYRRNQSAPYFPGYTA